MNSDVMSMGEDDLDEELTGNLDDSEEEIESSDDEPTTDNVGETSVEINVEDLIAEIEAESGLNSDSPASSARKRLDEILEQKRAQRELEEDFEDLEFS